MRFERIILYFDLAFSMVSLVFFGTQISEVLGHSTHWIQSPRVTNFGDWGRIDTCPGDGIVTGFILNVEEKQGGGLGDNDDTALNGIRLMCNHPEDSFRLVHKIESSVGDWGSWGSLRSCPYGSYAYGFRLRSEKFVWGEDCTGANNLILYCRDQITKNNVATLEGGGLDWGEWTEPKFCQPGYGICGIQTQVEPEQGEGLNDDTSLNNVDMQCCYINQEILQDD